MDGATAAWQPCGDVTTMTFAGLRALREHIGYTLAGVARHSLVSKERLLAIEENGEQPTFFEIEELATLFGVDPEVLAEESIVLDARDAIATLASLDEFRDIGEETRARVIAAANAVKELTRLRRLLGQPVMTLAKIRRKAAGLHDMRGQRPAEQGRDLAQRLRVKLKLGTEPVPSVRDLVRDLYPEADVFYASLGRNGPAGLSFADEARGAALVINLDGKNVNPLVRRFSLAHELCHLLVDVDGRTPLAQLSGYLSESGRAREQRANAFAVYLLCPASALRRVRADDTPAEAHARLAKYGLPYAAVRLSLRNSGSLALPPSPPLEVLSRGIEPHWYDAEEPLGVRGFPLEAVPPERRTRVAEAAAEAYSRGLLQRDAFAAALTLTPLHEVERVLDLFGLPEPADEVA